MNETYYTVEQISELLDIHPKTIQRYIREGKLRAVKIGKSWRVTGHDLSLFTEHGGAAPGETARNHDQAVSTATVSAVVDVSVNGKDDAIRIMNTLTAALNAKPPEYGQSSMSSQFIAEENKVRVMLWGGVRFMAAMMDAISMLTEEYKEE
jgi:excisionase family DNA binding protein